MPKIQLDTCDAKRKSLALHQTTMNVSLIDLLDILCAVA